MVVSVSVAGKLCVHQCAVCSVPGSRCRGESWSIALGDAQADLEEGGVAVPIRELSCQRVLVRPQSSPRICDTCRKEEEAETRRKGAWSSGKGIPLGSSLQKPG